MSGDISSAPRSHLSAFGVRALTYAILGVLWMLAFWTHVDSCPMGLHDWAYPCLDQQRSAYLPSLIAPWWDTDLGTPHALPQITLPWVLLGALVWISPAIGLRIFVLIAFVGAAIAADVASERLFGISQPWARWIAGALYAGSPFLMTKLASGQLGFIACAPLVPAALVAIDAFGRGGGVRAWTACAICSACAFAQIQVGLVLLALLPVVGWGRVRARSWLGVWAVASIAWLPAAYSTIVAYRSGALAPETQLAVWLADKSVPWQHALDGTAYFANYFVDAAPLAAVDGFAAVSVLAVLFALALGRTSMRLAVCALGLGLLSTGTAGPIGSVVAPVFARLPVAQVFREFYDLLFFAPLVVACGAAAGAARFGALVGGGRLRWFSVAIQFAILCLLLYPSLTGGAASLVPFVSDLPQAPTLAGDDRILWLPATPPVGPRGSNGGADPYQLSLDAHPDASAFHPTGLLAYVDALADRDRPISQAMLERLDIAGAIVRQGLVSQRIATAASVHEGVVGPSVAPRAPAEASILAIAPGAPRCEPDLRSELMRDAVAYERCEPRWSVVPVEDAAVSTDDPRTSWIGGERWALLDPKLAEPRWPVLFTRSSLSYRWSQPASGVAWIYAPAGGVLNGTKVAADGHWRPLATRTGANALVGYGRGIIAVSAALPSARTSRASQYPESVERPLAVTSSNRWTGTFSAVVPAHAKSFIVLRAAWSPGWRATVDGRDLGAPIVTDGYAAGWPTNAANRASTIAIAFAPSRPYFALLALSWLAIAALIVAFAFSAPFMRT